MELTKSNRQEYCDRHGYELMLRKYTDMTWSKCERTKLQQDALWLCDWELWMGVDTLITNMTVKVENIIKQCGDAEVIIGVDVNGINNDVMLIKNCLNSLEFLDYVINNFQSNDQYTMELAFQTLPHLKVVKVPQEVFNSYPYYLYPEYSSGQRQEGLWQKGDFIIHVPNRSLDVRIAELRARLNDVVRDGKTQRGVKMMEKQPALVTYQCPHCKGTQIYATGCRVSCLRCNIPMDLIVEPTPIITKEAEEPKIKQKVVETKKKK